MTPNLAAKLQIYWRSINPHLYKIYLKGLTTCNANNLPIKFRLMLKNDDCEYRDFFKNINSSRNGRVRRATLAKVFRPDHRPTSSKADQLQVVEREDKSIEDAWAERWVKRAEQVIKQGERSRTDLKLWSMSRSLGKRREWRLPAPNFLGESCLHIL